MKLFLAIDLPTEIKDKLYQQTLDLQHTYRDFRWVTPINYHISLFSFGDLYMPDYLKNQIEEVTYNTEAFRLYSADIRLFVRDSITVYLGFQKNKTVEDLVKKIKNQFNIKNDLVFFPHLTLARYRLPSKQQYLLIKKKCSQYNIDIDFDVTQITLFDSVIENKKPQYHEVAKFSLLNEH